MHWEKREKNDSPVRENTDERKRMGEIKGLSVIECGYCYNRWRVVKENGGQRVISEIREFLQPRDVELYHLCGVYHKMGVPIEITEIDYENYKQDAPYIGVMKNFSDEVCKGLQKGNAVLIPTGYCAHAPAIAGGIQRALGENKIIGVVWIDAHSDNRIVETSEASEMRFVSFPVSALVGQTMEEWRKTACGLTVPCEGKNVLASDIRMLEPEFEENMRAAGIVHLTASEFADAEAWRRAVDDLAERVDAIYLSVDADILKPEYIPAYEKVVPDGHDIDCVMNNIRMVMETGKVAAYSVFCVDFDHYENDGEKTYLSGMKMIAAGLENWKSIPE